MSSWPPELQAALGDGKGWTEKGPPRWALWRGRGFGASDGPPEAGLVVAGGPRPIGEWTLRKRHLITEEKVELAWRHSREHGWLHAE